MSIDYQHRQDISDEAWALLEPILPGQRGQWGGIAKDNRYSSMRCSGFCVQVHRGETSRHHMENGALCISAFADGGMLAFGKRFLKRSLINLILNGS